MYNIRMGQPEMNDFWAALNEKVKSGKANKNECVLFRKLGKALHHLSNDPRYPGLHSHEISSLSRRYGMKVWESYLENNTPSAGRLFWVYGPAPEDITVIGLEPHPNDKKNAYQKITLSSMGEELR